MKYIIILLTAAFLVFSAMAGFANDAYPNFTVKGFGTVGVSGTDTDRIGFRRDVKQSTGVTNGWGFDNDSRLGLQLDTDLNESWHATVQWVARNTTGDFFEQNLDWAFLRWRPVDDLDIRVGRLGFDVFMLSEYRNVGYAYPWIRPPHEFYGGIPVYHFDGADIAKKFAVGEGTLTIKAFSGYNFVQVPVGISNSADQGSLNVGGKLAYEYGNWNARIGYAYAVNALELAPLQPLLDSLNSAPVNAVWPGAQSFSQRISGKNKSVHYSSIGLAYDDGLWLAQMEASYVNSDIGVFPSVASGYFSAGRRFGKVTLYSLFGISESLNSQVNVSNPLVPVPSVIELRNATDQALNNSGVDEKSVSLGLRWDVYENIALKTQWTHYWLGNNGAALWLQPESALTPDTVNVWSVGMDFVF
ncbi:MULTISPECIES: hypothetical protein [Methylomonas]|uniref:Porin domain-containing protein n=1 Tax=Methylomonas koyamae TaxID=702114 RepID=A0A177P0Z5_9GAMM|nr:hypothetical protein [Methylomonas koyamae]OAI23173.1 hypothetical protein A1355_21975 [Methylomonas koyamae]